MSEEKKEDGCCTPKGCNCGSGVKLLIGLLIGAFIFAAGMWFAKSSCCHSGHNFCPFSASAAK